VQEGGSGLATSQQHIRLYGQLRKALLSRYFALGREHRNDFFQESTRLESGESPQDLLQKPREERVQVLWKKTATRDNPWLFGCKLTIALATEARLSLPGADALLGRAVRSCEQLFKFPGAFRGLPVRWDPVTSDFWLDPPAGQSRRLSGHFLVTPDGRDYVFSVSPSDARHFPYLVSDVGRALMGKRRFERYADQRNSGYRERYRFWEASQDEMVGVLATYVAAADGTRDTAVRTLARQRLRRVAEYLAAHAYLMVMPGGGLAARGAGDALPALEWPFTRAIARVTGDDPSRLATASIQEGLRRAGIWDLFQGPTDRAMAAAWATVLLAPVWGVLYKILAGLSLSKWRPTFLNPGQIGFVTGIYLSRDGFDVSDDNAASGMALAALLHSWGPENRFLNYVDFAAGTGPDRPYSTGFLPFLGFLAAGGPDVTTANAYQSWLQKRRDRNVDVEDYSATCFASAVGLLTSGGRNVPEERELVKRLGARHDAMAASGEAAVMTTTDVRNAADYMAGVALAWRYRQERETAGLSIDTADFPRMPASDVAWPQPSVPRVVIRKLSTFVPVQAIQGTATPTYDPQDEAPLFLPNSPRRPAVRPPNLTFGAGDALIYDETFTVGPGRELFTGIVLQWGDRWDITAEGEVTIGGDALGPDGRADTVWDARFPLHGGRDRRATEQCLLARLNNYVFIGRRRPAERWLYPDEVFLCFRLNQTSAVGRGGFSVRARVTGARRQLQRLLEVGCTERRDPKDRDRRLGAIGGVHRDGSTWRLPLDEAVAAVEQGTVFFVRTPGVGGQEVAIAGRAPRRHLRSIPDRSRLNNLLSLPSCQSS
jgi:hypothetical protein